MKILSIDVGVKNLAICLFEINSNDNYKILLWDIVDLENNHTYKCNVICEKTKKICDKNASFEKNNNYYCKIHSKKTNFIAPNKELNNNKLKSKKIKELTELCINYNIIDEEYLLKNKVTKSILLSLIESFKNEKCLHTIDRTVDSDLITLGKNMKIKFNEIFKDGKIDLILIENQISPLANKMKTLQGMISQYFIMKDNYNIKFISSKNKLKYFENKEIKTNYSSRKKMGISKCFEILENKNFSDYLEFFNSSHKKDDLADSFLQGLIYMIDYKIINYTLL